MDSNKRSDQFYADLPIYNDMRCVVETDRLSNLPSNWYVIMADVVASTTAIEKGQYREVNTVGVSVIIAVLNIADDLDIPYVFGGDGAILCIPASLLEKTKKALSATIDMTLSCFGLELRVGYIPVAEIFSNGASFKVARCRMSSNLVSAMFVGDGVDYVENIFKGVNTNSLYTEISGGAEQHADFSGFECRWQEVPSRHGETISLLVKATASSIDENALTYAEILAVIESVYGDESLHHPIDISGLKLSLSSEKLSQEQGVRSYGRGRLYERYYMLKLLFQNILGKLLFSRYFNFISTDLKQYKPELIRNTDYRKFDGMLRMVITGTSGQREKLLGIFDGYEQDKKLIYGIHVSDAAQITCLVNDRKRDHIHFVDGAGGGYTLAAVQLKEKSDKSSVAAAA